jgi:GH24 family phage-related lysozyme (muramidase)/phage baseplate assembly protein gpV
MPYINTSQRTTKPTSTQPIGRNALLTGTYLGFVKDATDVQRNGRLRVWIAELGSAPDNPNGWIIVNYCSPFAGATNVDSISNSDVASFEKTQTSYGMWMIPPDINNEVIVMFVGGDPTRGIWIGCLYNQYMNQMVPGMAASTNNWEYPGKNIPVAEYNKWDQTVTEPDRAKKPYEKTKFQGISNQGLINDRVRGTTSSSARREAPSSVFGIVTPGPVIDANVTSDKFRRKGGSSFIMDDGPGTEYVQLATKTGAQIRLDETNGFVYLINRDGTAWVQMDSAGNIDIFGAADISMRAQRDLNIRADRNVNIEAGQNIFMKAAMDTVQETTVFTYDVNNVPTTKTIPVWSYVGEGNGEGGNIVMQSLNNWHSTTQNNAFLTVVDNSMEISIGNSLNLTTITGGQDYNSDLGIKMTSGAAMDFAATGNIRAGSNGSVSVVGDRDIILCTNSNLNLKAAGSIIEAAAGEISMDASSIGIGTNVGINGNLDITGNITAGKIVGNFPGLQSGSGANTGGPGAAPSILSPEAAEPAMSAAAAAVAEVKQLVEKINILATWVPSVKYPNWQPNVAYNAGTIVINNGITYIANNTGAPATPTFNAAYWNIFVPEDKFKRQAEALQTTITRLPTYEPCPEHNSFSYSAISGYSPTPTQASETYLGSSGAGNNATTSPVTNTTPGANNVALPPVNPADSAVTKDFNMPAFECELKINEGVKYVSYNDSRGLPTAGIGHLLRANEISQYPVPSPVSSEQVTAWFQGDSPNAIAGAQRQLGLDCWGNLSDVRKRACADLCYNIGEGGLSKFKMFLAAMQAGDYNQAGAQLQNSAWFTQVGQRGPRIITMIVQDVDPNGCDKKFPPQN